MFVFLRFDQNRKYSSREVSELHVESGELIDSEYPERYLVVDMIDNGRHLTFDKVIDCEVI